MSVILVRSLVKSRKTLERFTESVRIRDSHLNDAIDGTVSILKELLDMAATSNMASNQFLSRLKQYLFLNPGNPESIFRDFDILADCRFYGVLTEMKSEYRALTKDDLLFCSFICFDFNPAVISMIYGHTNSQSYYNKRSRLRKRMGLGNEADHIKTYLKERIALLSDGNKGDFWRN